MDKRRKSSATPTAIITELIKLKSQQKYLDANQITLNPHKCPTTKEEMSQLNEVENLKTELEINLSAFSRNKWQEIGYAVANLKHFTETALSPANVAQLNMKQYRNEILLIDRLLREACQQNADELAQLRKEFMTIEDELMPILANVNLLRQHEKSLSGNWRGALTIRNAISAPIERIDSDDVRQFDRFVCEHGGHTGEWGDEAHQLFVKLRLKYKSNVDRICMELQPMLTGWWMFSSVTFVALSAAGCIYFV